MSGRHQGARSASSPPAPPAARPWSCPPSSPPALLVQPAEAAARIAGAARRLRRRSDRAPAEPGRRAASKPSPISTPFTAGIDMRSAASRPSSFRSQLHVAAEPEHAAPRATTSTSPPRVSPASLASSIRRTHRRLGGRVEHAHRGAVGGGVERRRAATRAARRGCRPSDTTWLPISTPNSSSSRRARAPAATRAAVSRALARSRMSRASRRSYLRTPDQVGVARTRAGHPAAAELARVALRRP